MIKIATMISNDHFRTLKHQVFLARYVSHSNQSTSLVVEVNNSLFVNDMLRYYILSSIILSIICRLLNSNQR